MPSKFNERHIRPLSCYMYMERTRTKTSIKYAKENDREKRERNKAQIKVEYKNYDAITISRNYYRKLSVSISMTQKMWKL